MFDGKFRAPVDAAVKPLGKALRKTHMTPDHLTVVGLLIAFEGPDGAGKTTQRKLFKTWLKGEGHDVVTSKWSSSRLVKPLIKARKKVHALGPEEFCLLHAVDFRHRLHTEILPALWQGKTVLADRFLFTGFA